MYPSEAPRDVLTGLPGIEAVQQRLSEWDAPHVVLLGLRKFDTANLANGASVSDGALAEVAVRLLYFASKELDGPCAAARSGANFLLVANEACSRERWQLFAEQLADRVARPIALRSGMLRLSPRLALLRGHAGESPESMLDRLSQTLALIKSQPGRRIAWADGAVMGRARRTAQLDADFLGAIDGDQIEILYQPQFSLPDDRLTGAEALARWNHPVLGRIGADALFSVAQRVDQADRLSRHIACKAMVGAGDWPEGLRLSLNVTPADLAVAQYGQGLLGIVTESGFPPERLTLEVTEQALLSDVHLAGRTLREIAAQGICVALDDFGAGFCNFRYLKLLPLHYLKLDRSMVEGITDDPRDLAVLRAIVAMARALDLKVIAEGIETEAQRLLASQEGCAFYQGFLRARPMTADDFLAMANS